MFKQCPIVIYIEMKKNPTVMYISIWYLNHFMQRKFTVGPYKLLTFSFQFNWHAL